MMNIAVAIDLLAISDGAKALLNGSGTQMTNNEILTGNRYLIYYNKCDGIFQVINHIVTPATPAA